LNSVVNRLPHPTRILPTPATRGTSAGWVPWR